MVYTNNTQPSAEPAYNPFFDFSANSPQSLPTKKIVLVGPGGSGKSIWRRKILTGQYGGAYVATLGVEVNPKKITAFGLSQTFNLWDTAGQEKFAGLAEDYYIGTQGFIFFFDLATDNQGKFYCINEIPKYLCLMRSHSIKRNTPLPHVVFVANKKDLVTNLANLDVLLNSFGYWLSVNGSAFGLTTYSIVTLSVKNNSVADLLVPLQHF